MFTGIIEHMGTVVRVEVDGSNKHFWISSSISEELKVDQSVAHNGVCLTVDALDSGMHRVTAIAETLNKSNANEWKKDYAVNLERCLQMNGRLDGHIVQGHVDSVAVCTGRIEKNGSTEYSFEVEKQFAPLMIEKGSICLNGISLTIFNVGINTFSVAIIPYTILHTNIGHVFQGDKVNVEFDVVGKYLQRFNAF